MHSPEFGDRLVALADLPDQFFDLRSILIDERIGWALGADFCNVIWKHTAQGAFGALIGPQAVTRAHKQLGHQCLHWVERSELDRPPYPSDL